jgi:hypothetical protein
VGHDPAFYWLQLLEIADKKEPLGGRLALFE